VLALGRWLGFIFGGIGVNVSRNPASYNERLGAWSGHPLVFRWGVGRDRSGNRRIPRIERHVIVIEILETAADEAVTVKSEREPWNL
jgi:hypothetical protein